MAELSGKDFLRINQSVVTGSLLGVSNASVTGASMDLGRKFLAVEHLNAYLIVTAATSNLTVTPFWQVSNDASNWASMSPNATVSVGLPVVTGTANVTKTVPSPIGLAGYRYARCMLAVGGATGAAGDLYSIGYSWRINAADHSGKGGNIEPEVDDD
jgi:hypothetical protein